MKFYYNWFDCLFDILLKIIIGFTLVMVFVLAAIGFIAAVKHFTTTLIVLFVLFILYMIGRAYDDRD